MEQQRRCNRGLWTRQAHQRMHGRCEAAGLGKERWGGRGDGLGGWGRTPVHLGRLGLGLGLGPGLELGLRTPGRLVTLDCQVGSVGNQSICHEFVCISFFFLYTKSWSYHRRLLFSSC